MREGGREGGSEGGEGGREVQTVSTCTLCDVSLAGLHSTGGRGEKYLAREERAWETVSADSHPHDTRRGTRLLT